MFSIRIYKKLHILSLILALSLLAGCAFMPGSAPADGAPEAAEDGTQTDSALGAGVSGDELRDFLAKKRSVSLNPAWKWADLSEINSGNAVLYTAADNRKDLVIGVNAGHGTAGGEDVKTYCHPDKTPKITNGSNPAGSLKALAVAAGMLFDDGQSEADVTLHEAQILRDMLLDNGYDVLMLRDGTDVQLDNVARTVIANNMADCMVSVHWDGDGLNYDKGCFYVPVPDEIKDMEPVSSNWREHERLGKSLLDGLRDNGNSIYDGNVIPQELTQTCYATIPAVVVELGNQCSAHDEAALTKLAKGLLAGIEKWSRGEESAVPLKSAVTSPEGLGDGMICGACVGTQTAEDDRFMELVEEHFNAITLENELKPDALFGYNNDAPPAGSIHEEELDGRKIEVPTIDHSRADALLDKIIAHNAQNPDDKIRIRGHVLVWHSQTPEWFFHVDYDKSKDYVSKEEMDRRLKWYIGSVLGYYTGEDSKYRDLFYGWDVVNEAISDRTGSWRTDNEQGNDKLTDSVHSSKSSWWKVYGSSEYIVNAFKYANEYAPEDLKLYYNDYNECDKKKKQGILALIEEVRSAEGARIDGFGMQGHYSVYSPTAEVIGEAAQDYADAAGSVMITELDVKTSMLYNGSDEGISEEYERQAKYYRQIYDELKKLRKEGIAFDGITFWGVTDNYSWLCRDNKYFPLLFDKDYNAKPAFYSFLEP